MLTKSTTQPFDFQMEEIYKTQVLEVTTARDEKTQLAADQAVKIQQLEQHLKEAQQVTQEKAQLETELQAQEVS